MGEPTATGYLAAILATCADVLGRRPDPEESFFEIGGDSATATDLFLRLESRLGVELDVAVFFEARDFRELAFRLAESTRRGVDRSLPGAAG
ncbi:acyl carrier protein [Micromonospora sp. KC723]|uniref:acyl carrier protein n=1 Tax=Micromonospora sp. KC723 TaxID=2530381 RepID=UPI001051D61C|nr:acyl carrier protein [Micromonospora sp. KC723]TDB70271.1 acyl carrier protein [Micromonospora sp. KC723]